MIGPEELQIRGAWAMRDGRVIADSNCERIEALIRGHLSELTGDPSGWDRLFVDPNDGRFWELTYEHSHMHGGGPPTLTQIPPDAARAKYVLEN